MLIRAAGMMKKGGKAFVSDAQRIAMQRQMEKDKKKAMKAQQKVEKQVAIKNQTTSSKDTVSQVTQKSVGGQSLKMHVSKMDLSEIVINEWQKGGLEEMAIDSKIYTMNRLKHYESMKSPLEI